MSDRIRSQWLGPASRTAHLLLVSVLVLVGFAPSGSAQSVHQWTEIDSRGTAVDWHTLERTEINSSNPTLTVWARTVQGGTRWLCKSPSGVCCGIPPSSKCSEPTQTARRKRADPLRCPASNGWTRRH